ncbi:MAG: M20 family metallopeptidase [Bacteroidetes bacterium]|nr:M20 family metallopeptidase [Bacteroidota bacterium]
MAANNLTTIKFTSRMCLSLAREIYPEIVKLRRHLHQYPELAFEERYTNKVIAHELSRLNIKTKNGVAGTGIVGILESNKRGRVIALRADMDALPVNEETGLPFASKHLGKMHACGHDTHMSMLIGAAKILSKFRKELNGTVKFLFQPSEEKNPGGAPSMIKSGALSNPEVDVIFGQHITPDLPVGAVGIRPGPTMASADEIYITIYGKGGHGAKPHQAIDPILISAHVITALQAIISRSRNPLDASVLTIGSIHGGTATNIIPDSVKLTGTFRAMNERWRAEAHLLIKQTAEQTARGLGGKCKVEISRGYPVLINSEAETEFVRKAACELLGKKSAVNIPPVMGAEDFAYYLQKKPGTFWWIGGSSRKTGRTTSLHSSRFKIDETAMIYGAAFLAYLTLRYLSGLGENKL